MIYLRLPFVVAPCALAVLFAGRDVLAEETQAANSRPNVLMIMVDDLRPELGCYGCDHIQSPNIDRFASSGRLFARAYCQQAVCNPSRTSLMTGLRPDTIGVTGNHSHFRDRHPDVVTLPQHFKRNGYHAIAIGKIYHGVFPDGASITKWDTMGDPESWSEPAVRFGPRYYYTEQGIAAARKVYQQIYRPVDPGPDEWSTKLVFGPATEAPNVADNVLYDGKVADAAVEALSRVQSRDEPFFLAVGFIKPHSPYIAPKPYFDLYEDVSVADATELPHHSPEFAGHNSGELRRYTDQPKRGEIPDENQRRVRQAYYACVSYIDHQVGRVLNHLDQLGLRDDTIVVLLGDHGYHLGEHGLWGKTTNFELDTRVPLIVRVPGMDRSGESTSSLVELVDLYPTLVELAGLPRPSRLEGESFQSVLRDPGGTTKDFALSQYPRRGGLMGYSIRTDTHRYTSWIEQSSGREQANELYAYDDGPVEKTNIVTSAPQLAARLSKRLVSLTGKPDADESASGNEPAAVDDPKDDDGTPRPMAKEQNEIDRGTSFEELKPGRFDQIQTSIGTWSSVDGKAVIDSKHAKSGRQCLQLTGGKKTSVTLDFNDSVDSSGVLTFWAERWTSRSPFSFRIERQVGDQWQSIYEGSEEVRVGRAFLSHIKVQLADSSIRRIRLTVSSPQNTGILIDDVRVEPATKQQVVRVEGVPFTRPALVGGESNDLCHVRILTTGVLDPLGIQSISGRVSCSGDIADVKNLSIHAGERSAQAAVDADGRFQVRLQEPWVLAAGDNQVSVACALSERIDIDGRIGAVIEKLTLSDGSDLSDGSRLGVTEGQSTQRIGVALRDAGADGVHTYRIPGLVTTNEGTLIAVYDARHRSRVDLPGDIDVGMSRSTDGGRTWEPMKIIMDMGDDPDWRYDGIGDPAILVDQRTGTIWVAATWSHGDRSWRGSGPGLAPEETGQLMLVRSDDDGASWSDPINITEQIKRPEWCFILQGPGKGITMRDGTIVFAAQYQDPPENDRLPHSTIIYSQDHGETWQVGTGAFDDTTESQVVEVEPGVLMLNCRYNRQSVRVVMTTDDMGATWTKHTTSKRSLIEPSACMASLIDVDAELGKDSESGTDSASWLLFSNPDSLRRRERIMIKGSPDRGLTWPARNRLLLDDGTGAGYSCMTMIDEQTVGILYEGSQSQLTFQRIPLSEITGSNNADSDITLEKTTPNQFPKRPTTNPKSGKENRDETTVLPEVRRKANLSLPRVFGDHMVLQAGRPIPVWGRALAGAQVTVEFGAEKQTARADADGQWQLRLDAREASDSPAIMNVRSAEQEVVFQDVLVGEVWVCAGQSNMEWPLDRSDHGDEELAALPVGDRVEDQTDDRGNRGSGHATSIRLLHLSSVARGSTGSYQPKHLATLTPELYCNGNWRRASQGSAADFSAVAWYFGRKLQDELGVPVGLICPAVGGTPTESWVPRNAMAADEELRDLVEGNWLDNERLGEFCRDRGEQNLLAAMQMGQSIPGDDLGPNHSFKPGFMWSAGIEPLIPYAIRGAIWYQGESNAETRERTRQHSRLFPLMLQEWRRAWGQGDFPFLQVQLPALNRPHWPLFRETQRRMHHRETNVGLAVTLDTGHPSNVHPTLKKPVGIRLALQALGMADIATSGDLLSGPIVDQVTPVGSSIDLSFQNVGDGLKSIDSEPIRYFEVAGEDGRFHPARATIRDARTVNVSSVSVPAPQDVRYGWLPFPRPSVNLAGSTGLPTSPFSTQSDEELYASPSVAAGNSATGAVNRPNILLIVGEDHGCELSCYGDPVIKTPNIDALAASGMLFENGYVTQSVCSPSRSTIFTGLYPHQNGQLGLATHRYRWFKSWPTTYSLLKQSGYRTGLIGKTHVLPEEAVEDFVDFRFQRSSNFAKKQVAEYAKQAGSFFQAGDEPFFMTVNYPDAHWPLQGRVDGMPKSRVDAERVRVMPYVGHENRRLSEIARNYYDCMLRLDECVGQLLDSLEASGKSNNTVVIFVGDHGAQMARGKVTVYEGGMRVPYIVRWPGVTEANVRSRALVSTTDLLPTFTDIALAATPAGLPGKSLRDVLAGGDSKAFREYLVCERNCDAARHTFPQRTIRDDRFKLIYSPVRDREDPAARYYLNHGASHWSGCPTESELAEASTQTQAGYARWLHPGLYQLYDLDADPYEWNDLADDPEYASVRDRLIGGLRAWQDRTNDPIRSGKRLQMLLDENDAVFGAGDRWPKKGWQYLDYWSPSSDTATDLEPQPSATNTIPSAAQSK